MERYKLVIRAFKAVDNPDACQRYVDGHMKVLRIFGITMITSAKAEWIDDPYTYVIMVESDDGEKIYGGARIQLAGGKLPLPLETAVEELEPNIHQIVEKYASGGTGEFCGLWNSREVAGLGIGSMYLGRAALAITDQLDLSTLFGLCAPSTVKNSARIGFEIATFLGQNGTFYYPKQDLVATAVVINDTRTLETADPDEREIIMDLRRNPNQFKIEEGPRGRILEIDYKLRIEGL